MLLLYEAAKLRGMVDKGIQLETGVWSVGCGVPSGDWEMRCSRVCHCDTRGVARW